MMLPKVEAKKRNCKEYIKSLNDIEVTGKALYLDKNLGRASFDAPRTKPVKKIHSLEQRQKLNNSDEALLRGFRLLREKSVKTVHVERSGSSERTTLLQLLPKDSKIPHDQSRKGKKETIWNKALKALTIDKNLKFRCGFSLQVHSIEGLPLGFNGRSLCVHWKRRDEDRATRPVKVFDETIEFEETLMLCSSVCGTKSGAKSGPHTSVKYEAKHCLLHASVVGAPDLDLGKHRIDLTRLLPLTLAELEEEESSGKWTTSFKLSGKARGATMNVSFGYMVLSDMKQNRKTSTKSGNTTSDKDTIRHVESLPCLDHTSSFTRFMEEIRDRCGGLPSSKSDTDYTSMADQKFDEYTDDASIASKPEPDVLIEHFAPTRLSYYVASESSEYIEKTTSKPERDVLIEHLEPTRPSHSVASESSEYIEKTASKPEPDVLIEHLEPTRPSHSIASESSEYIEKITSKPEPDVLIEHLEPTRPSHSIASESSEYIEKITSKPEPDVLIEHLEPTRPSCSVESKSKEYIEKITEDNHSYVVEKGEELPSQEQVRSEEVSVVTAVSEVESHQAVEINPNMVINSDESYELHPLNEATCINQEDDLVVQDCNPKVDDQFSKEALMRDLELALEGITNLEAALDSPDPEDLEDQMEDEANYEIDRESKSHSLDDLTESVASEFLSKLGIDHSPFCLSSESETESPRERLLRQFEKETLATGGLLFDFDMADGEELECSFDISSSGNLTEGVDTPFAVQDDLQELLMETNGRIKVRAKVLEDLETEALMNEWGLNEKAFQYSPSGSSTGLESPVQLPLGEPLELPPLGDGLGPLLQLKDGGFLRSMNPSLFRNSKSGGNLIMQVSSPIVVPVEMGSGIIDILQRLASVGIENFCMQANKLMPLEDMTGKTMQEVARANFPTLEGSERQHLLRHDSDVGQSKPSSKKLYSSSINEMDLDYASLEELTPLAMDKIEALSMEGLRIQSGMSDEDAPSNISAQSIGGISALKGKGFGISGSLGLEGTAGLQLSDIKDSGDDVGGLMGLSLTLDEWMRLDSGDIGDEYEPSERTFKILAAHHATSLDLICRSSKGDKRWDKKCGLLGNNFMVALMVQLRNPTRNYEPVGAPMLALIQVQRLLVPPKRKIYRTISAALKNNNQENNASGEEGIPHFRITEVHVAGLDTEPTKTKLWDSTTQQLSGSRWLLANGMGKSNKHMLLKSPLIKVQPGDNLWSISSCIRDTGAKWKGLAASYPHIRNPNVIFPQ